VHNSDIEGGINFATVVLFGSQPAYKYGTASFYNTILRSHGDDHAIFGFANAYGTIYAVRLRPRTVPLTSPRVQFANALRVGFIDQHNDRL
jgi:hypothetical protein